MSEQRNDVDAGQHLRILEAVLFAAVEPLDEATLVSRMPNDADVPAFTIVDNIEYHPDVERWEYPKAGDPNPGVRLGVVRAAGGDVTWIDLEGYAPSEPLIVDVGWTPDSRRVVFQVQDREQTWLDLVMADADSGRSRALGFEP